MSYRYFYVGLGMLAVAVIALATVYNPEGEPTEIPAPLESVFPPPNDVVIRQATVEIDLEVGYEAEIFIDGFPVTDATFQEPIGVYRWSPSPTSPVLTEWTPGDHTIRVTWSSTTGAPDFGEFEWTFRVQ